MEAVLELKSLLAGQEKSRTEGETVFADTVLQVNCNRILPNPAQPRVAFSSSGISQLADSIRQYGIIQPLVIREGKDGFYELVAGERRLRAAKFLQMKTVPCVFAEISPQKSAEVAMIENLVREDLNIFEQATAISALIENYGLTQEKIAQKLSCSQSYIANKLRLLHLTAPERELILVNRLTERHARALLRIPDIAVRDRILNQSIEREWNVAQIEEAVDDFLKGKALPVSVKRDSTPFFKDVRAFYSTIRKAADIIRSSGVEVKWQEEEQEEFTQITILVPKERP